MYITFKEEVDKLARKTELPDVYKIANDLGMLVLKKGTFTQDAAEVGCFQQSLPLCPTLF